MKYIPTIGLEIHAQLNTRTKMFCDSLNPAHIDMGGVHDPDEQEPNIHVCPVCLAHPGTLPVANIAAIEKVVQVGLALNCAIGQFTWFERKNYFYPDLPKGYQISQYEAPFCQEGELTLSSGKTIRITRVHLEEDTGRLLHDNTNNTSLVDYNRAGVPLMELVTEPDIETAAEAREFGEELRLLLRYLDASGADMERGQMRLEANVSVRPENIDELGTKVELKNINSFKALERAIEYEIKRQTRALENGEEITQETRGWDGEKEQTFSQRIKEGSADYRYFPEPDLPPVRLEHGQIESLRNSLPELPQERRERLQQEYGVKPDDTQFFVVNQELGGYFEHVVSELKRWAQDEDVEDDTQKLIKLAANYIISELQGMMLEEETAVDNLKITPENFAELIIMVQTGEVSSSGAQEILKEMFARGIDPSQLLDELGLKQVSDKSKLKEVARQVLDENPEAVEDYKDGKEASLQFMVGQIMRHTQGAANPEVAAKILKKLLQN